MSTKGYGSSLLVGGLLCEALGCPMMYMLLGILSVVIFILHVGSLYLWPSLDANRKAKHVTADQDISKEKEMQTSEAKREICNKEEILEQTHL